VQPVLTIDITVDFCPITFMKPNWHWKIVSGEVLQVRLNGGEAEKKFPIACMTGDGVKGDGGRER
jgi:hypothetical protein